MDKIIKSIYRFVTKLIRERDAKLLQMAADNCGPQYAKQLQALIHAYDTGKSYEKAYHEVNHE